MLIWILDGKRELCFGVVGLDVWVVLLELDDSKNSISRVKMNVDEGKKEEPRAGIRAVSASNPKEDIKRGNRS
jgi:hypothetical protein